MIEGLISSIIAGSAIPSIAYVLKKIVVDHLLSGKEKEIIIKNIGGKDRNYIIESNTTDTEIKNIIESEINIEKIVKEALEKFAKKNKNHKISVTDDFKSDFIVDLDGKKIAIEAKPNLKHFKAAWAKNYMKRNDGINKLIMIINSSVSSQDKEKIKLSIGKNNVDFVHSPNIDNLKKQIEISLNNAAKNI